VRTRWLEDCAWPLWLEHGVDWKRRAFHEHVDLASLRCRAEFRRLRVAARQTYVFSKAAGHGVPGARDAVSLGLDFLRGPARLPDGGFAWRFDLDNRPIDQTRDLYDHAFVLLAFAAAAAVAGTESLRAEAIALIEYIAENFAHPAGGYEESIPPAMPRRQNPHMHLFEALLAAHDAFGDEVFFARAEELVLIFSNRLFQAEEGALPEYFDAALVPQREAGRFATCRTRSLNLPTSSRSTRSRVSWSTACGVTAHPGMAAFGCGPKPSGSRRRRGARMRRRTIWRRRSSPLASTSKVSGRGSGSNDWMPMDMAVEIPPRLRACITSRQR
jgi:hypothetical protein